MRLEALRKLPRSLASKLTCSYLGNQQAEADVLLGLASAENERGNPRASTPYFSRAIETYDQVGLSENVRMALLRRSIAEAKRGNISRALDAMDKLVPRLTPDASASTSDSAVELLKQLISALHGSAETSQRLAHAHLLMVMVAALLQRYGRQRAEAYVAEMRNEFAEDFGELTVETATGLLRELQDRSKS